MLTLRNRVCAPKALMLALVLLAAWPIVSVAQGAGSNGRGPGSNFDKKCAKFVNCHDARDGRVDGRGPAAIQTSYPNRHPGGNPNIYRDRDRTRDDYLYRHSRNRRVDRDGDRDETWNRRSRERRVNRDAERNFYRHEAWHRRHERAENQARRVRRHERARTERFGGR